jgi:plasmid stabilization system protein ParE
MSFAFHPEAKAEFYAAIDYYEIVEVALGLDFSIEVFSTIQNIVDHPHAWPVLEDDVRRCLVHRFPYGVLYSIERDEVFILAVMHLRRDPDYWKSRVW